ncbi:uncharacterized protein B0J16DRAFT_348456 [Fusarium flagelliforme]|uniref:uncharacterized protein n=1 Tax=Fusarium flagelliforme TaxID=2675880 RepID=UPI001E8CC850|nr:uncharacterized protein B0J16DRAFT_348456 [Fusarium flagelliforme]KAH7174337.1 hypothetical protein B0J16DRAFT_348456 [Fusarium flagelliforme]
MSRSISQYDGAFSRDQDVLHVAIDAFVDDNQYPDLHIDSEVEISDATGIRERAPKKKKQVYIWTCCCCLASGMRATTPNCPGCGQPRCPYCRVEKKTVRE